MPKRCPTLVISTMAGNPDARLCVPAVAINGCAGSSSSPADLVVEPAYWLPGPAMPRPSSPATPGSSGPYPKTDSRCRSSLRYLLYPVTGQSPQARVERRRLGPILRAEIDHDLAQPRSLPPHRWASWGLVSWFRPYRAGLWPESPDPELRRDTLQAAGSAPSPCQSTMTTKASRAAKKTQTHPTDLTMKMTTRIDDARRRDDDGDDKMPKALVEPGRGEEPRPNSRRHGQGQGSRQKPERNEGR